MSHQYTDHRATRIALLLGAALCPTANAAAGGLPAGLPLSAHAAVISAARAGLPIRRVADSTLEAHTRDAVTMACGMRFTIIAMSLGWSDTQKMAAVNSCVQQAYGTGETSAAGSQPRGARGRRTQPSPSGQATASFILPGGVAAKDEPPGRAAYVQAMWMTATPSGLPRNKKQYLDLLTSAAAHSYIPAEAQLAKIYADGILCKADAARALPLAQAAAARGNALGETVYAELLITAPGGVAKNGDKIAKLAESATLQGNPIAAALMGEFAAAVKDHSQDENAYLFLSLNGKIYGYQDGKKMLPAAAKRLTPAAIARMDATVRGFIPKPKGPDSFSEEDCLFLASAASAQKFYTISRFWLDQAAAKGSATAENEIGRNYHNGVGITKNYAQAKSWFDKSAAHGNALAEFNLGIMNYKGEGMPKDVSAASQLIEKSAALGYAQAEYVLGLMYYRGEGVAADHGKAVAWLQSAARQGLAPAKHDLLVVQREGERGRNVQWRAASSEESTSSDSDDGPDLGTALEVMDLIND